MRSFIVLALFLVLPACGSSDDDGAADKGNAVTAVEGTQTCTMMAQDPTLSEPYVVEGSFVYAGNGPKAPGSIQCAESGKMVWGVLMDQPGPIVPQTISDATAKLNSQGYSPVNIQYNGDDGAIYFCSLTGLVCVNPDGSSGKSCKSASECMDGMDCRSVVLGKFNFEITYAAPAAGSATAWLVKATGHAECAGATIDVVFDVK